MLGKTDKNVTQTIYKILNGNIKPLFRDHDFLLKNKKIYRLTILFNPFKGGGMFMKPLHVNSQIPELHQNFVHPFIM